MRDILGIILGGGQGRRLYPLTKYRSKPAVPLGGKYRLIDIPISNCINSGLCRIFVLTQFNSASLNRHISLSYNFDYFREGFVDILAAEQTVENTDWFQGTSDAVRKNLRHFRRYRPTHYLILAGDHIYRMDFRKMYEHHREHKAEATVAVTPVERRSVPNLGILKIDANCRIIEFREKPKQESVIEALAAPEQTLVKCGATHPEKRFLASMGIYLFNANTLEEALSDTSLTDFGSQIIPRLVEKAHLNGFVFNGYWEDIGTIETFYRANIALTTLNPTFDFFSDNFRTFTNARFLPGSKIDGVKLAQSIVCEGSIIRGAKISRSIIGLRSVINEGAEVTETVLMGADYLQREAELEEDLKLGIPHIGVGPNSRITGAIIDKNARIGEKVRIGPHSPEENFAGPGYMVRSGITVVEKDAVIADGMEI